VSDEELAKAIARSIFEVGDEPHDKAQRIQFMGGRYPGRETILGGLSESSLASFLSHALARIRKTHSAPESQ
jgi:hypothetical protein